MRVLIIEQEKTLQKSLSLFMARHKDFDVSLAQSLGEGRSLIEKKSFDVVLCRDRLPDGDGLEILKEVCRKYPTANSILMTAHGDESLKERAKQAGIRGYLEKPFELKQLEEAMGLTGSEAQ
jgi:DNA-binding response OmpR family regulator